MRIGNRYIGVECAIVGEIGINHNGQLEIAKRLIEEAADAGFDAVKFQKRTPELCVPERQRSVMKHGTPWGDITYIEYKEFMEFGQHEYEQIAEHCHRVGIDWFASCWDIPSVDFLEQFDPPCYKVASASITDMPLLRRIKKTGKPVILSTGMSTFEEINDAVYIFEHDNLLLTHTTSCYPCHPKDLNLLAIPELLARYNVPVGYSGHEVGLAPTLAAVALGAVLVERHITLDRTMWGTDQAASVEPQGMRRLVKDIRLIEKALGNGVLGLQDCEIAGREKLRG